MPTGRYAVDLGSGGSWRTISNAYMWHRQVKITCNGKYEEWDLFGGFVEWWEAQEICAKLGKTLPANTETLTSGCTEGARWSLIANATAVGTGQTLAEVSNIAGGNSLWNSSTGVLRSHHPTFTQQDYGNYGYVWTVSLFYGSQDYGPRGHAGVRYVLCGPAN